MFDTIYINSHSAVPVEILEVIDSTNEEAKRRIKNGGDSDFVLIAKEHTAGKGRKGRSFYSPKSTGLYLSFVHFSDDAFSDVLKVTVATSVIASTSIKDSLGIECGIKWVNDLYFKERKVSGTLCECILKNTYDNLQNAIIVGIGINVSTDIFPDDILSKAGSLIVENSNTNSRQTEGNKVDDMAIGIINGLNEFFEECTLMPYMDIYKKSSIVLNKKVVLSDAEKAIDSGVVKGFDDNGALILERDDKSVIVYDSGEISLKFDN